MRYLDYALNSLTDLLANKPRLKDNVLLPLDLFCNATVKDVMRLVEKLKQEYKPFQPYDDDAVMRKYIARPLLQLSRHADRIMSERARAYLNETANIAKKLEDKVKEEQCKLFLIVLRNLLILYSNYDKGNDYFDLRKSAITYKSVYELCGAQIREIYQWDDYGRDMHNPEEMAEWTIHNGLPVNFSYTVDDPAYKGLKKIWYGNPQIVKKKEITVADCDAVQFYYCAVLTGLNTMLEGSRNG